MNIRSVNTFRANKHCYFESNLQCSAGTFTVCRQHGARTAATVLYEAFRLPDCYASWWIRKVHETMSHYTHACWPPCTCPTRQIRHHLEPIFVFSQVTKCDVTAGGGMYVCVLTALVLQTDTYEEFRLPTCNESSCMKGCSTIRMHFCIFTHAQIINFDIISSSC
jgi:hypothetical protein